MNTHDPDQPRDPEQRPLPPDNLDPALLDAALAAMRAYHEAGRAFGTAFVAYLDLDFGLDPEADEEADFQQRYVGYYPDRSSFLRSRLDALGWSDALAQFKAEQGMWPDDVRWDEGVLWEHMSDRYGVVERLGGVYAFTR